MSNATENNKTYIKREQRFSVEDLKQLQVVIKRTGEGDSKEYFADLVDISRRGLKFHVPICVAFAEEVEIRIESIQAEVIYEGICTARHIRSISENCWEVGCSLEPHLPEEVIDFVVGVSGKERRANPRISISHSAEMKREGQVEGAKVEIRNISLGGICLAVNEGSEVGERVKLQVLDPDKNQHVIAARIRWQNTTDDGYVVGCSFVEANSHLVLLSCLHETQSEEGLNWYVVAAAIFAMFLPPVVSLFVSSDGQAKQNPRQVSNEVSKTPPGTSHLDGLDNVEPKIDASSQLAVDTLDSTPKPLQGTEESGEIHEQSSSEDQVSVKVDEPAIRVAQRPTPIEDVMQPGVQPTQPTVSEAPWNAPSVLAKRPEDASDKIDDQVFSSPDLQSTTEVKRPAVEVPVNGQPVALRTSKMRRKVDPPKVDPPKVDPPKVDPPKVDPPKVDPPKVDPPKVDPPKVDPPKVDPPKVDPPKVDPPKVDPPKVDPPKVDPPKVEDPKVEDPNLRVWRHHSGMKTVKAILKRVNGDQVFLENENGKELVLAYDWFSIDDLLYLGEVGDK